MINTNKLDIKLNIENIKNDFDIYILEKKENLYKTNVLDTASLKYRARAVQFLYGARALLLFDKNEDSKSYINEIKNIYEDVRIQKVDMDDKQEMQEYFFDDYVNLIQLLFNTINYSDGRYSYNNLSGKLYYFKPDLSKKRKNKGLVLIEIKLSKGYFLNLNLRTLKKYDEKDKKYSSMLYIFDKKNNVIRRKLKTDRDIEDIYVQRAYPNHKNSVEFFSGKNIDEFNNTKLGIMCEFLDDVNDKLSKYISVELSTLKDVKKYDKNKDEKEKNLIKIFNQKGLNIVDEVRDEESEELLNTIKNYLSSRKINFKIQDSLNKEKFNLRIIRNKEHYKKSDKKDKHISYLKGHVIQHITVEDFKISDDTGSNQPAIENVFLEMIIKDDIINKNISLYDFGDIKDDINYISREKCQEEDKDEFYIYHRMNIKPDGKINFETFDERDVIKFDEERQNIIYKYNEFDSLGYDSKNINQKIEYLIYKDKKDMYAILKTPAYTVPKIFSIRQELENTDPTNEFDLDEILKVCRKFIQNSPKNKDLIEKLMEKFLENKNFDEKDIKNIISNDLEVNENISFTAKEIRNIQDQLKNDGFKIKMRKEFDSCMKEICGRWIDSRYRRQEDQEKFNVIKSFKDIYYINNERGLYYFVGSKNSLNTNVKNANTIRVIKNKSLENVNMMDDEFANQIMEQLAVEFVRYGQYTVYPFPIKYLREYMNMKREIKDEYEKYKQMSFDDYINMCKN